MNEEKLTQLILKSFEREFPKKCPRCGKVYNDYKDFILNTKQLDEPVSYDEEFINGTYSLNFFGVLKYCNCQCGDTLVIQSFEPNPLKMFSIMFWVRKEKKRTGMTIPEMVSYYNKKVDALAMSADKEYDII